MIFEPIELKDRLLKNRVVSAPLASSSSNEDGSPRKVSGDLQTLCLVGSRPFIVEHHAVTVSGRTRPAQFLADSDETARNTPRSRRS